MDPIRVLIAEDDAAYLHLMEGHLTRRSYEVVCAANGQEALKVLESGGRFAVLVTDLTMPKLGGLELLRSARELDAWIEVIVITASNDVESAISAMREDGAYDYLVKPLETIGELSLAVERAHAHRTLRLEREQLNARLAMEASRLKALLANTGDAILSVDENEFITIANSSAKLLIGQEEVIGHSAKAVLPAPLAATVTQWEATAEGKPAVVEVPWPEGAQQVVSLTPITRDGAPSGGWVMVIRDITHLKKLGELKIRLLTEAARKIRLPLAHAVSTLSELSSAANRTEGNLTSVVYRQAKLLGHIQSLLDDLTSLVRIEAGLDIHLSEVDLESILNVHDGDGVKRLEVQSDTAFTVELEAELPLVQADPELLQKLLRRMIERASGGRGGEFRIAAQHRQDQVWIEVTDTAKGSELPSSLQIPEGVMFDFTSGEDGVGFEMAMIKAMADAMGGKIWVRGGSSGNSSIALCLPALVKS